MTRSRPYWTVAYPHCGQMTRALMSLARKMIASTCRDWYQKGRQWPIRWVGYYRGATTTIPIPRHSQQWVLRNLSVSIVRLFTFSPNHIWEVMLTWLKQCSVFLSSFYLTGAVWCLSGSGGPEVHQASLIYHRCLSSSEASRKAFSEWLCEFLPEPRGRDPPHVSQARV